MTVTLAQLQKDADAIPSSSPKVRTFAQDMVGFLRQQPAPPFRYGHGISAHMLSPKVGQGAANYMTRLASMTGAKVIRDDCYPGTTNANLDVFGSLCVSNGITRQNGGGFVAILWGGGAPPSNATMQAHATNLVSYMETNWPGVMLAVEPDNEPNINPDLLTPAVYAAHCNAVYAGVKAASNVVKVWGGATSGAVARFAQPVIQAGARFDEWSCHPYPGFDNIDNPAAMLSQGPGSGWSEVWWVTDTTGMTLAQALAINGYTGPIHATEFGVPTKPPTGSAPRCSTEATQATVFTNGYATWRAQPRAGWLLLYTGQDDNTNGQTTEEDHFGAFRDDGSAKPVVAAMKAA